MNGKPSITATTPGSRTGTGQVTISATASSGATVQWYAASAGGSVLATGNSYTTPSLGTSTYYYAEAYLPAGCVSANRVAVLATVNRTWTCAGSAFDQSGRMGTGTTQAQACYAWLNQFSGMQQTGNDSGGCWVGRRGDDGRLYKRYATCTQ